MRVILEYNEMQLSIISKILNFNYWKRYVLLFAHSDILISKALYAC